MDSNVYLYLSLFLICIYLIYYFNNKMKAKLPISYNFHHKNNLLFYPINYHSNVLFSSNIENKYWSAFKTELMLYHLAIEHILTPIIEIIYLPKNILTNYINV